MLILMEICCIINMYVIFVGACLKMRIMQEIAFQTDRRTDKKLSFLK
jgi:hypothetical protein